MNFCSLGSGSSGNSYIIQSNRTLIMIDSGFVLSELEARMSQKQIDPFDIKAIFLTHEHDDHSKSAFSFAEKYKKPIFLTHGTFKMCQKKIKKSYNLEINKFTPLDIIDLKDIKIHTIPVPHDAREPTQFKFEAEDKSLAIITDLGFGSNLLIKHIKEINALILESNHDTEMLSKSKYPKTLKDRILGNYGHLSNIQSLEILKKINLKNLQWLGAAHLSKENNTDELVRNLWKKVFKDEINIIDPDFGMKWVSIS